MTQRLPSTTPTPTTSDVLPDRVALTQRGFDSDRLAPVNTKGWVRSHIAGLMLATDAAGIAVAWAAAWTVGTAPTASVAGAWIIGALVAYVFGAYVLPRPARPWSTSAGAAIGGVVYLSALMALGGWVGHPPLAVAALLVPAFWPALVRVGLGRMVMARAAANRWLVIGTPEVLRRVERERIQHHLDGEFCYLVVPGPGEPPAHVLGSSDQLDRHLARRWTGIVIGELGASRPELLRDLMIARLGGVRVYDLTDFWEVHLRKVPVLHLDTGWVVLANGFHLLHDPVRLRLKRLTDLLLSGFGLLLGAPLFLLTALAVRFTSRGPVLFTQQRVGAQGEPFTVYKFRTMVVGSETGDKYTAANDSRITSIGGFLRKSRLDELPQLWNILRGDMSFIGPRAEWTKCVADYEHVIPFYHLRHTVKPGLTGWAQVNYPYGASVEDALEKLEYDLWYIKHHSLFLDLRIILKTVRVVLFGMGR